MFEDGDAPLHEIGFDRGQVGDKQRDLLLGMPLSATSKQHHRWCSLSPRSQKRPEVSVSRDDDALFLLRAVEDLCVACVLQADIAYMQGVVTCLVQPPCDNRREGVVDEESHPAAASGNSRSRTASAA